MKYRRLGRSDLHVSEISLGSWLTYGAAVDTERAKACVHAAFEAGINFIDTANVYAKGAAETFLGDVLADVDRSSYVLATKLYFPMSRKDKGLSAVQIRKQIDASLKRLRTDYVDLYQCHRYDRDTPLEETMAALTEVVRQGKARAIGFSEWTAPQIRAALAMEGVERFVSSQPQYSLLHREPERAVFPLCEEEGIGNIVWSPLAQGILTGKYQPGSPPPAGSRAADPGVGHGMGRWRGDKVLHAVQDLVPIAQGAGLTLSQLALAWVLKEPAVSSAIIGASRPEQVRENAGAAGVELSTDVLKAVEETVAGVVD